MSMLARMQTLTIMRLSISEDSESGQDKKTYAEDGTLTGHISPLSENYMNVNDKRFEDADSKLFTYNKTCGIKIGDKLLDSRGQEYLILWVYDAGKMLTATLKQQVPSYA